MQVSLKEAHSIQEALKEHLGKSLPERTVQVSLDTYQPMNKMVAMEEAVMNEVTLRKNMVDVLFGIRQKVDVENHQGQISSKLNELNALSKKVGVIDRLTGRMAALSMPESRPTTNELDHMLQSMEQTRDNAGAMNQQKAFSVISDETFDELRKEKQQLTTQVRRLKDTITALNVNTMITLSVFEQTVLEDLNLV